MIFGVPESSIFTLVLIAVVTGFAWLQAKYLKPNHSTFTNWAKNHGRILMVTIFMLLILIVNFGTKVTEFMNSHHGYKYGFIMICVLGILEILRIREPENPEAPKKKNLLQRILRK